MPKDDFDLLGLIRLFVLQSLLELLGQELLLQPEIFNITSFVCALYIQYLASS